LAVSSPTWRARLIQARAPLFLALVTLLAYSNSLTGGFTLDSKQAILNDTRVHALTVENVDAIFTHTYWWPFDASGLYRPLTTLTYLGNYVVFGQNPVGFHLFNLLLHVFCVVLVWFLTRNFAATLLWSVHPILTESVTNLVGRADLLAALGTLGAIWYYRRRSILGVALATTVAVFSKETGVVIPVLLLLFGRDIRRLIASAVPVAVYLGARAAVMADALPRTVPFLDNPLTQADFLTKLSVLGRYVWLLAWPSHLSADYSYNQIPATVNWLALATLVAAAILLRKKGLWVAILMLPVSNLLFPIGTILAERFLYLPAIAFALCVAPLWKWRAGKWAICAVAAGLFVRTYVRNFDWRDDRTMAESLVHVAPDSYKSHKLMAFETNSLAEAEKAIAILGAHDDFETFRLAGGLLGQNGQFARSAQILERIPLDPNYPGMGEVLNKLASDYLALGRTDDAAITLMVGQLTVSTDLSFRNRLLDLYRGVDCALQGTAINPNCPTVHRHLCAALRRAKKTAEMGQYACNN
jgi:hypothetical protein